MLESRHIRHKGLKRLWRDGDASGIKAEWLDRIDRILVSLNAATAPADLDAPGSGFHRLTGDRRGQCALTVTGNWRIVFEWDSEGPHNVTLEDYHDRKRRTR